MDPAGVHVFVTGGSRGIGRAIAEAFVTAGARVSLSARREESVADAARSFGGIGVGADLADPSQLDGLIGRVEEAAGPVDVLVNNAGIEVHAHIADQSAEQVRSVFETNLLAPAELCRQVLPGMLERRRGHIVNVSSMSAAAVFPGISTYGSSKAGLSMFTRGLRMDLKGLPVGTTAVEIGTVPSDMLGAIEAPEAYKPTRDSFFRTYRLQLMVHVPKERVAEAVVEAVRKGRQHVWLPRRAMAFPALLEAPQRVAQALLVGVRKHER
jgi:NAD(P)-dependent dehydrogenase (short-subunit alcohol dehydrogenase family)